MIFYFYMMLKKGDTIYILHYYPEIYLEIYIIGSIVLPRYIQTESLLTLKPIVGGPMIRPLWIEDTLNLNKLIKRPVNYTCQKDGYFISTNEELIIKKLNILIKYSPKHKNLKDYDND